MTQFYAVIDIGTLKVKFLIASLSPSGEMIEKYSSSTLTCFGCEMDANHGFVLEKNLKKTIDELSRCKKILKKFNVKNFRVVSTHAMRCAKNKDEIIKRIKKQVGFEVENITQEQEAKLFFSAVLRDFPDKRDYAVLDMGGGSVQVLIGSQGNLKSTHMMQTGAQFLHDNFTKDPSNPESFTTLEDLEKMKNYILKQLLPLKKAEDLPLIYGSSNIIDLMKAIKLPLEEHGDSKTHPYKTYSSHLQEFMQRMLPYPYAKREEMYPFQWGYMWGIDKAFLNVNLLAKHLNSPYIIPSNANIAQGFIYEMRTKK
jgi:exopolyphosphatase/guanosine-5'-triphosphate,3'-diphosphate pyrophosphatase